jgi:2-methylcitrate dehydratase PrpD
MPTTEQAATAPLISETLARFAAGLQYDDIPENVRERARYLMLDAVGIAFASGRYGWAHAAVAGFSSLDTGRAVVVGMNERLTVRDSAAMNGVLVHGLDYDDTHLEGVMHVSASCFPCAYAASQATSARGRDLLLGYILGIEVASRLGKASHGKFLEAGFHLSGTLAAFSSSLAAGRMMNLPEDRLVMAQGIALSTMPSCSRQYNVEGAWTKRLHPGGGAAAGIAAAGLAQHGFVGPKATYEGRYGVYATHMAELYKTCDLSLATAGLGKVWETMRVAIKPMPACHLVHACSDAAVLLAKQHDLRSEDIASIRALVPPDALHVVCEPVARRRRPVNSYAAQFSIQYAVASSIVRRRFGFRELEPDEFTNPEVLALADRVDYEADPHSGHPVHFSGEVIVNMKDGRLLSHREQINRGCADRPLPAQDIVAKFMDNTALVIPEERALRVRDAILAVDAMDDLTPLHALLHGAGQAPKAA